ncbi:MAG: AAA family ATPase [Aestuariivita sp.]|nr:AAA family ATPase [Aestuariivita sp.]MCY4202215.1 AAA family ATPase [Aestuariivita sp.]
MSAADFNFSEDQEKAFAQIAALLKKTGIDLKQGCINKKTKFSIGVTALLGKAGSGKTMFLSSVHTALMEAGVVEITSDAEFESNSKKRSVAVLAPTNKAASVLRLKKVPATTIHRIMYSPIYNPELERVVKWLQGDAKRPSVQEFTEEALNAAQAFYKTNRSIPGALAASGMRGSDFIVGWSRREEPLDIGLIDEASMLNTSQFEDLQEVFPNLFLFGDPAQLAPVSGTGVMVFDNLKKEQKLELRRIHRQTKDNPILDLAHSLARPDLEFSDFQEILSETAARDERVVQSSRVDVDLAARSPVLVWRNATRVRLIHAFRTVHVAPEDKLIPGEPLICDGIEFPQKFLQRRQEFESRGLVKGAFAVYLGPTRRRGYSQLHLMGAEKPKMAVETIIRIERPDETEPLIPVAARMGALFLHGCAVTIHKSQGSQWETVQIFAPDIQVASKTGLEEVGQALWKRLAYVAITRATKRLIWVVESRISKPTEPLGVHNLNAS